MPQSPSRILDVPITPDTSPRPSARALSNNSWYPLARKRGLSSLARAKHLELGPVVLLNEQLWLWFLRFMHYRLGRAGTDPTPFFSVEYDAIRTRALRARNLTSPSSPPGANHASNGR